MTKNEITKQIIAAVLIAGIFGYGGYYLGSKKMSVQNFQRGQFSGQFNSQRQNQGQRINGRGGLLTGEVLKLDDKSITIKLSDGGSKTAYFTASTSVDKSVAGAVTDLKAGDRVMVNGKANSDGSINADIIQIRSNLPNFNQVPRQ